MSRIVVLLISSGILFQEAGPTKDKALNCASFTEWLLKAFVHYSFIFHQMIDLKENQNYEHILFYLLQNHVDTSTKSK